MSNLIWYGSFGIWSLGTLIYVLLNGDDYAADHWRTLIAFWFLIAFLSINRCIKKIVEWRTQQKRDLR